MLTVIAIAAVVATVAAVAAVVATVAAIAAVVATVAAVAAVVALVIFFPRMVYLIYFRKCSCRELDAVSAHFVITLIIVSPLLSFLWWMALSGADAGVFVVDATLAMNGDAPFVV